MNLKNRTLLCWTALFMLTISLSVLRPCSVQAGSFDKVSIESDTEQLPPGRLAVLPFVKGLLTENFRTKNLSPLTCPVNQFCPDLNEGDETVVFMATLDKDLHQIMKKKVDSNLLPREEAKGRYQALKIDPSEDTTLSIALTLASQMKADYVLVPILWDYSERVGNQLSAEKPAAVSFALYLVSAQQKKRVWKAQFDRAQQSLTDNLLNFKNFFSLGGKWITAEELAQIGIDTMLDDFPLPSN
jgi:hypothetical protein